MVNKKKEDGNILKKLLWWIPIIILGLMFALGACTKQEAKKESLKAESTQAESAQAESAQKESSEKESKEETTYSSKKSRKEKKKKIILKSQMRKRPNLYRKLQRKPSR